MKWLYDHRIKEMVSIITIVTVLAHIRLLDLCERHLGRQLHSKCHEKTFGDQHRINKIELNEENKQEVVESEYTHAIIADCHN